MSTTISSPTLQITFGDDPLVIEEILHRPSDTVVCAGSEQHFLVRLPLRPSDPIFLTEPSQVECTSDSVSFRLSDVTGDYVCDVCIAAGGAGLTFQANASGPGPVWMLDWMVERLHVDSVIVPGLGGQVLTGEMPGDRRMAYKYPFWWNAQFALAPLMSSEGGVFLRTQEAEPRFKLLRVQKGEGREQTFAIGLGFEADGKEMDRLLHAEWFLDGYEDDWRQPVDQYRRWMEQAFALSPAAEHLHYPAWVDDINFVLEVWGMRKDRGRPAHTFDETIGRIETFAKLHPPEQTLLYLAGFAEGGIDSEIPDYNPSLLLGGRPAFKRLVDAAHRLGYRVMIHTNVLGMVHTHRLYDQFKKHQVIDPFGRLQGWGNDLDGDWLAEPYFAYINPGATEWGDLMTSVLGDLIQGFGLDAVFLDQTLLAFNVSRGPNFVSGMRQHIRRLQQAFPTVLFAGEGQHEQTLPELPVAQIHGIDSLFEVHGLDGEKPWRKVHPVSSYLFGKYTKFVAHLLTRHPSNATFARQEDAYAELGVIPALVLYNKSQEIDTPEVHRMLERARELSGSSRAAREESRAAIPFAE